MKKTPKKIKSFEKQFQPKPRREYIDYDYINKLSPEERKWLARFSDEFYGADFKINDTFIIEKGSLVQISGNIDRSKNRDLRKYRKIIKFYEVKPGVFSCDEKYRYSNDLNIHQNKEHHKSCNAGSNSRNRDISSIMVSHDKLTQKQILEIPIMSEIHNLDLVSPEDRLILEEEMRIKWLELTDDEREMLIKQYDEAQAKIHNLD